ncbi:MAG: acyl-CoA dehydratase activase-related protein [Prevotellaceae bacterium]|jgi:predicted nucleotide-binding protein (sugar kinase/HSP70/actin superfamily)|nr:acyl-CoA dehydratase activase-related protein [Prevotellaceae bacterium]
MTSLIDLQNIDTKELTCHGCTNTCRVLRFRFPNGNVSFTGNKCEKVFFCTASAVQKGFNGFDLKNEILFGKQTSNHNKAKVKIGIPRVLNMYENFPFWHTLFTECDFEVVLSPETSMALYQRGINSVMSDNICFPAKVAHGHILALIDAKPDRIFYPIIPKEEMEFEGTDNSYNCPVVSGYPEVIRSAINPEKNYGILFDKPVITFGNKKFLKQACYAYFSDLNVEKAVFEKAFGKANFVRENYNKEFIEKQKNILQQSVESGYLTFIVAGRPYHSDLFVNQKVGQILSDLGINVLTDDIFRQLQSSGFSKLNMVSQWSYPNRVVQTALEVAKLPANIQMVQLNSFGCGPDSFLMEEIGNILKNAGKNHTVLRIDEIASTGSIRLRLRSLIESLKATGVGTKSVLHLQPENSEYKGYNSFFTKKDKGKTVLIPWFTDFLSPFIPAIAKLAGYMFVNCPKTSKQSADVGLKYGNNEVCYPATLILGDLIAEIKTGKYNLDNLAVAITQTGGQCRATNYLGMIKAGLKNAGFDSIPVISVSFGGDFHNEQEGFKLPVIKILNISIYALLFGDTLQQMYASTIVREKTVGQTQQLFDNYMNAVKEIIFEKNYKKILKLLENAVEEFNKIEIFEDKKFEKVGLIGEIFVKYNNYGQAHITEWLRKRNMEVVTPPIIDFFIQTFVNREVSDKNGVNQTGRFTKKILPLLYKFINIKIKKVEKIAGNYRFFEKNESIFVKADYAVEILDLSNQFGEGWMIAGEVASFAHRGINRVVCVQPFGCIANHVVAKGVERRLKTRYPEMNLLYLDIDGGMAEVNLQNRLEFLIN